MHSSTPQILSISQPSSHLDLTCSPKSGYLWCIRLQSCTAAGTSLTCSGTSESAATASLTYLLWLTLQTSSTRALQPSSVTWRSFFTKAVLRLTLESSALSSSLPGRLGLRLLSRSWRAATRALTASSSA
jgi:hypothetical protein